MIIDTVESINGYPIRLTEERWHHIVTKRPFMSGYMNAVLDAVENPEFVLRGNRGAKIAVLNLGRNQWLQVMYKELKVKGERDGFIISAYIESSFNRKQIIWKRDN